MKVSLVKGVLTGTILALLISQILFVQSDEQPNMVGVESGDIYNFQLIQLLQPYYNFAILGSEQDANKFVVVFEKGFYTLTVLDTEILQNDEGMDYLNVKISNEQVSTIEQKVLWPGYSHVSFTNWNHWQQLMSLDPFTYWGADFNNQTINNSPVEFEINVWWTHYVGKNVIDYNEIRRYDKQDGVATYIYTESHPFDHNGLLHKVFEVERLDYQPPEIPTDEPTTTTTITTTTSTVDPSPSDTSTTSRTIATTTTTTRVISSDPTTSTTTTVTTTTSRTLVTSSTASRTMNTETTSTPIGTTTTAETTSRTIATSSTSSRTLSRTTSETTFDRTTDTTTTAETGDHRSQGASDSPGFGLIFTFTALIALVISFKRRK